MKRIQSLWIATKKKKKTSWAPYWWRRKIALVDWATWWPFSTITSGYNGLHEWDVCCIEKWKDPPQIELIENPGERAYLKYSEDISKNHPGGLKGRKCNPKVVLHHETPNNPLHCFVRLFKLYQSKCPPDRPPGAFYLKPLKNPRGAYWYAAQPIGRDKLNGTVARICKAAGIQGFKTNHSLRATAVTCLYHADIDEQIIMETTGHRSLEGVRSYKRTSDQQKESISDILSLTKRFKAANQALESEASHALMQSKTALHQDSFQDMFTFSHCSNININVQFINKKTT